jgi:excisionase family DNA binding protein
LASVTDEPMLRVPEVARRLSLDPETVRRWIRAGKIKATLMGSNQAGWRIPESEVRRLLGGEP